MPAIAVLFLFSFLSLLLGDQAVDTFSYTQYLRSENQATAIRIVGKNIADYQEETGRYPDSLTALAATSGYESVKGFLGKHWLHYSKSTDIDEAPFRFDRAAIFVLKDNRGLSASQYLSATENACGTGDFDSDSWCGNNESIWQKFESRHDYLAVAGDQQKILDGLINRFARFYNKNSSFPNTKDDSSVMSSGASDTLASIVGCTDAADACSGIYFFESIPFGCNDLFGLNGSDINYRYFDDRIILTVETAVMDDSGNQIVMGSTVEAP
jgi:hypothetical protein